MPGKPWTKSQIDTLRRMHDAGKQAPEIAAVLGRTPGAVRSLRGALGLRSFVQLDDEARAYIHELYAEGKTEMEIVDLTGRVVTTVRRVLDIHLAIKRRWTVAETRKLYALRAEGMTYPQVAQVLGRTPHACVMRYLTHEKIRARRAAEQRARKNAAKRRRSSDKRVTGGLSSPDAG